MSRGEQRGDGGLYYRYNNVNNKKESKVVILGRWAAVLHAVIHLPSVSAMRKKAWRKNFLFFNNLGPGQTNILFRIPSVSTSNMGTPVCSRS